MKTPALAKKYGITMKTLFNALRSEEQGHAPEEISP
jgi:hypothetical protein